MTESTKSPVEVTESSLDELRTICNSASQSLFAILDACDEPRVPEKVNELGNERAVSLYRGAAQRDYWAFAPYLVIVDEQLLDWIVDNLWEDPWGIFTATENASLEDMRKHFRQFLLVEGPDGNELYFRFYDPRVMKNYLADANFDECQQILGPVNSFHLSDEQLCRYQLGRS